MQRRKKENKVKTAHQPNPFSDFDSVPVSAEVLPDAEKLLPPRPSCTVAIVSGGRCCGIEPPHKHLKLGALLSRLVERLQSVGRQGERHTQKQHQYQISEWVGVG
jgi:hypothetical protein